MHPHLATLTGPDGSFRILDLARELITLSGFRPDDDIAIDITVDVPIDVPIAIQIDHVDTRCQGVESLGVIQGVGS